jgi:hypothetical protein|tara:strand:- start:435 stop:605 length:171 start_codon:yes stop_codon:yes gene_type:complete
MKYTTAEFPIKKEILKLEIFKERLLGESEILWDEVNAIDRDIANLKKILEGKKIPR